MREGVEGKGEDEGDEEKDREREREREKEREFVEGEGDGDAEEEIQLILVKLQVRPDNKLSQCRCFPGLLTDLFETLHKTQPNIFRKINTRHYYTRSRRTGWTVV